MFYLHDVYICLKERTSKAVQSVFNTHCYAVLCLVHFLSVYSKVMKLILINSFIIKWESKMYQEDNLNSKFQFPLHTFSHEWLN